MKNRALKNMSRSMLVGREIQNMFWSGWRSWEKYILNRSPNVDISEITTEEA